MFLSSSAFFSASGERPMRTEESGSAAMVKPALMAMTRAIEGRMADLGRTAKDFEFGRLGCNTRAFPSPRESANGGTLVGPLPEGEGKLTRLRHVGTFGQ